MLFQNVMILGVMFILLTDCGWIDNLFNPPNNKTPQSPEIAQNPAASNGSTN